MATFAPDIFGIPDTFTGEYTGGEAPYTFPKSAEERLQQEEEFNTWLDEVAKASGWNQRVPYTTLSSRYPNLQEGKWLKPGTYPSDYWGRKVDGVTQKMPGILTLPSGKTVLNPWTREGFVDPRAPQTTIMGEQVAPPTPTQGMAGTQSGSAAGTVPFTIGDVTYSPEQFESLWGSEYYLKNPEQLDPDRWKYAYDQAGKAASLDPSNPVYELFPDYTPSNNIRTTIGSEGNIGTSFGNWDPSRTYSAYLQNSQTGRNAPYWENNPEWRTAITKPIMEQLYGPVGQGAIYDEPARLASEKYRALQETPQTTPMGEQITPQLPTQALPGTQAGPPPVSERLRRLTDPNLQEGLPGTQSGAPVFASEELRRQADRNVRRSRSGINEFLREQRTKLQPTVDAISQAATTAKAGLSQAAYDVSKMPERWGQHARFSQAAKGLTGLPTIPEYGMQTGYDFQKKFDVDPRVSSYLASLWQVPQEIGRAGIEYVKNPVEAWQSNALSEGWKRANVQAGQNIEGIIAAAPGGSGLTPEQQTLRNKYLVNQQQAAEPIGPRPFYQNLLQEGQTYSQNLRPATLPTQLQGLPTFTQTGQTQPGILAGRKRAIGQALTPGVRGTGGAFGRYKAALGG